jgi:hypothetical protein
MSEIVYIFTMATFSSPELIRANPQAMLWLLPLAAAVAIVYKATKLHTFTAGTFVKETALLFVSIVGFIIITALVLYALVWAISV